MKKLLLIVYCAITLSSNAQITEEHTYDDMTSIITLSDMSNLFVSRAGQLTFEIYTIDHQFIKQVVIDTSLLTVEGEVDTVWWHLNGAQKCATDKLFDLDDGIEFPVSITYQMVSEPFTTPTMYYFDLIVEEDGSFIEQKIGSIYNTSGGTKMLVDNKCYGLPGSLPENSVTSQQLTLVNDTLSITDGNFVVLEEDQELTLKSDTLSITNGNYILLSEYKNTDKQELSLSNDTLYISGGNYVTMSLYQNKPDQELNFSNDTLYLSEGGSVYLGNYWQQLGLSNDTLYLTNGGKVYIGNYNTGMLDLFQSNIDVNNFYPNPTSSLVYFDYSIPSRLDNAYVGIFNNKGVLVKKVILPIDNYSYEIDLSELIDGIYYIQIITDEGLSSSRKIIKVE